MSAPDTVVSRGLTLTGPPSSPLTPLAHWPFMQAGWWLDPLQAPGLTEPVMDLERRCTSG